MDVLELLKLAPQFALAGASLWFMYKITGNHINHATQAMNKQTDAIIGLTKVVAELKTYLETRN